MTDAHTTRETADHAELKRMAEAAKALWLDDGWFDYRTLSLMFELDSEDAAFIASANPARVLALLSEIAALRGERTGDDHAAQAEVDEHAGKALDWEIIAGSWKDRATQAERQRDELRKAMPDLSSVIAWLDNGCEPKHAVTELSIYKARIDQALANQGADQ